MSVAGPWDRVSWEGNQIMGYFPCPVNTQLWWFWGWLWPSRGWVGRLWSSISLIGGRTCRSTNGQTPTPLKTHSSLKWPTLSPSQGCYRGNRGWIGANTLSMMKWVHSMFVTSTLTSHMALDTEAWAAEFNIQWSLPSGHFIQPSIGSQVLLFPTIIILSPFPVCRHWRKKVHKIRDLVSLLHRWGLSSSPYPHSYLMEWSGNGVGWYSDLGGYDKSSEL
jgi:hypothetical protein